MSDLGVWEKKLNDTGGRIRKLLVTAAAADFADRTREAFVDSAVDAAKAGPLKRATESAGEATTRALDEALADVPWATLEPRDGTVLAIPAVKAAVEAYDAALSEHFAAHELGRPEPFTLPARFIDGDNLVSLTRSLWKAATQRARAQAESVAEHAVNSAESRRKLWDQA